MKLTCLRGYPGSGKSAIAKTLPGVVVCRDDLRMQLYGRYDVGPEGEVNVTIAERAMVRALLNAGRDVIVDAMHVNPRYLKYWAKVASETGADFVVKDVLSTPEECIERDCHIDRFTSQKMVGEKVIRKIAQRYPCRHWPNITAPPRIEVEPYISPNDGKPPAIIVDIDGTLAHHPDPPEGRSPYDYSRVHEDTVDPVIAKLVVREWAIGYEILILSGRDDSCRADTERWLKSNHIPIGRLLMRPPGAKDHNGNKLPDWVVKLNLFNEHVRGAYNVEYVLDDRNQVVRLWRRLGLKCLQVEDGDF